jgi:ribosome maturation factor RimP
VTDRAVFAERITSRVEPLLQQSNLILETVTIRQAGRRLLVQIVADSESTFDLDAVARISHELDDIIEEENLLDDMAYTLEMTSPGIDRPLSLPRHWRKNIGRLVNVELADGSQFTDRIVECDETFVTFTQQGTMAQEAVARAIVQIEFNKAAVADTEDDDFEDEDDTES